MERQQTTGTGERTGLEMAVAPARAQRVYPVMAHWAPDFDAVQWTDALMRLAERPDDALAIDVHLP